MKIVITEEQKKNLFIPRNLGSRYDKWNSEQPEIIIDDQIIKLNRYDSEGNKIGVWLKGTSKKKNVNIRELKKNYIKTKSFFKNIFDQLKVIDNNGKTNYMIGDKIYIQDPKNGYLIRIRHEGFSTILSDQYSLKNLQIQGLVSIWMEMKYKLGPLFVAWL